MINKCCLSNPSLMKYWFETYIKYTISIYKCKNMYEVLEKL